MKSFKEINQVIKESKSQQDIEKAIENVITNELKVSGSANWAKILAPKIYKAIKNNI